MKRCNNCGRFLGKVHLVIGHYLFCDWNCFRIFRYKGKGDNK